jgi:hypothetical protein
VSVASSGCAPAVDVMLIAALHAVCSPLMGAAICSVEVVPIPFRCEDESSPLTFPAV